MKKVVVVGHQDVFTQHETVKMKQSTLYNKHCFTDWKIYEEPKKNIEEN